MKKIIILLIINLLLTFNVKAEFENNPAELLKINNQQTNKINWQVYIDHVNKKIEANWNPPEITNTDEIVVKFNIGKEGNLINSKTVKSSGSIEADRAAISAIEKSSPFEPLPVNYKGDSLQVEYKFRYNLEEAIELKPKIAEAAFSAKITDWKTYLKDLDENIKTNWTPPSTETNSRTVLTFQVNKEGELVNYKIKESSGIEEIDNSALDAIIKSSPFKPIEDEFSGNFIPIKYVFNNNAYNIQTTTLTLDSKKPDWTPYMEYLKQTIRANWNPPKIAPYREFMTTITINRDGKLINCKIKESSGVEEVDNSALEAIAKSAPFKPLPEDFTGETVSIKFAFDKNLLRGTYKKQLYIPVDNMDILFNLSNRRNLNNKK